MRGDGDDELMARYARGDIGAFEQLYDRYESPLYEFCVRQLADRDDAADAFQEVVRRVVDARHEYEPRGTFAGWLFTIARRVCIDRLREAARTSPLETVRDPGGPRHVTGASHEHRLLFRDELQRLLALLPPEQREVLLLSKYSGFTYGEIARMVGGTEAGARQKAYRALKTLRAHLASERP
ncbi:MAG: RNA polymerase sigma factor [Gemmatimonadota bacterium]